MILFFSGSLQICVDYVTARYVFGVPGLRRHPYSCAYSDSPDTPYIVAICPFVGAGRWNIVPLARASLR